MQQLILIRVYSTHIYLNCIGMLYNTLRKYNNNRACFIIKTLILECGASGFLDAYVLSWEFETMSFLGCEFVVLGV